MRELKFRAWDKINKCMYLDIQRLDSLAEKISRPKEYHVMQYTGLKDKNGKEIYEGDIINGKHRFTHSIFTGVVTYVEYMFDLLDIDSNIRIYGRWDYNAFKGSHCKVYEIIGNIYENLELLENHER